VSLGLGVAQIESLLQMGLCIRGVVQARQCDAEIGFDALLAGMDGERLGEVIAGGGKLPAWRSITPLR